jgi:hypothetical protein
MLASLGAACGAAPPPAPQTQAPASPPLTDGDPPTFTPAPSTSAATGAPVGLAMRGRDDEARRTVMRFLEALRDRDLPVLEALLADPLTRSGGVIARTTFIAGLQRAAETNGVSRGSDLALFFDVPGALVEPISARRDPRRASTRYRDDDLIVTFPVRAAQAGRRMNEFAFVRVTVGEFVVRLTPEPKIVGL